LISDYFPKSQRGTAFSIFALGVPFGTALGNFVAGWTRDTFGWRATFFMVGLPGVLLALLMKITIKEPPRGYADRFLTPSGQPVSRTEARSPTKTPAPPVFEVFRFLFRKASFVHLSLGTALHSVAWYAGSVFNAPFLIRSHAMTRTDAGFYPGVLGVGAGVVAFVGGVAADRLGRWRNDRRWYLWVPGIATVAMIPFHWMTYLHPSMPVAFPAFCAMMLLAAVFFGPSFGMA